MRNIFLKNLFVIVSVLTILLAYPDAALADYTITTGSSVGLDNWGDFGEASTAVRVGQQFTTTTAGTIATVRINPRISGTPGDHVVADIMADSAGKPSNVSLGTSNTFDPTATACPGVPAEISVTWNTPVTLAASTKYWVVFSRTGAINASNFYYICGSAGATSDLTITDNGSWGVTQAAVLYTREDLKSIASAFNFWGFIPF